MTKEEINLELQKLVIEIKNTKIALNVISTILTDLKNKKSTLTKTITKWKT